LARAIAEFNFQVAETEIWNHITERCFLNEEFYAMMRVHSLNLAGNGLEWNSWSSGQAVSASLVEAFGLPKLSPL